MQVFLIILVFRLERPPGRNFGGTRSAWSSLAMQFLPSEGMEMVVLDFSKGSSFDLIQNLETEAA
jgi:hypothetical protein